MAASLIPLILLFLTIEISAKEVILSGRGGGPLYRIDIPDNWEMIETPKTDDTMLPIAEWKVKEVKIMMHNFPGMNISPESQVERWKRQAAAEAVIPQAFSGFKGLLYENDRVLAWALSWKGSQKTEDESFSDITFKATGNIDPLREEIIKTVRTFERLEAPCSW